MKLKIPKTVKVGGTVFKVIYPYAFREGSDDRGQVYWDSCEIRVQKAEDPQVEEQTFMHELLHAIQATYNGDVLEDNITERMAQGLYQVIKDNDFLCQD